MRRTFLVSSGFLQNITKGKENFFTSLWNKPSTRDDRVKDYIPHVMEESLLEEKAVQLENNSRDSIVEIGNRIITEIEKKSPTSRMTPYFNKLLAEYGVKDLIYQRPLSYLIYPNSSVLSGGAESSHELVLTFSDNFRSLVEEVEKSGCSVKRSPAPTNNDEKPPSNPLEKQSTAENEGVVMTPLRQHEPLDITLFVRVAAGMALANINCGDFKNAIKCVDAGLLHARDPQRIGGLYGMKSGILIREGKYEESLKAAQKSIEASHNLQGYLQGACALQLLHRFEEEIQLLESAREFHPMDLTIANRLNEAKKSALSHPSQLSDGSEELQLASLEGEEELKTPLVEALSSSQTLPSEKSI